MTLKRALLQQQSVPAKPRTISFLRQLQKRLIKMICVLILMPLQRIAMHVSLPPEKQFRGKKCADIWKTALPAKK
jgi:hypothetical protein